LLCKVRVKSVAARGVVEVEVATPVEVVIWAMPGLAQSAALKPSKVVPNRREEAICSPAFCNACAVESRPKFCTAAGSSEV
jgi:hypothetical protein